MEYFELVLPEDLSQCLLDGNFTRIFHLNARSVKNKHDVITSFLNRCRVSFEIIMFSETWYQQDADVLVLPGYKHYFLNRQDKRGGGVSIYVKTSLECELLNTFSGLTSDYDVLSLKIGNYIITVLYRPPSGDFGKFIAFLDRFFERVSINKFSVVMGGDFNVNVLDDSFQTIELKNVLSSSGFVNIITSATRITQTTSNAIDLFITNCITKLHASGTMCADISDHFPIFCLCLIMTWKERLQRLRSPSGTCQIVACWPSEMQFWTIIGAQFILSWMWMMRTSSF